MMLMCPGIYAGKLRCLAWLSCRGGDCSMEFGFFFFFFLKMFILIVRYDDLKSSQCAYTENIGSFESTDGSIEI